MCAGRYGQSGLSKTGIGLRAPHIDAVLAERPNVGFLEVHTENYFGGGAKLKRLERLRHDYPLSFHGVGLSLGRADDLDADHLDKLCGLVDRYQPALVSEHLSWSGHGRRYAPDLLPLPYCDETVEHLVRHIEQAQTALQRTILIENPSHYLAFEAANLSEPDVLREVAKRTGCSILLDVNNIVVSAHNLGFAPQDYVGALCDDLPIGEIHLAGHTRIIMDDEALLIDTHGAPVGAETWSLYASVLQRFGDVATLIEWDADIPALAVLIAEAEKANVLRHEALAESQNEAYGRVYGHV